MSLLPCSRVILVFFFKNAADLGGEASYRAVFTNHHRELRSWKMAAWGVPSALLSTVFHLPFSKMQCPFGDGVL